MKDVVKNIASENAHKLTPFKLRFFTMISVHRLRPSGPKIIQEHNDMGLIIQRPEFYDEFEFPQLCVNLNKKELSMDELRLILKNMNDAITTQLRSAGVLK